MSPDLFNMIKAQFIGTIGKAKKSFKTHHMTVNKWLDDITRRHQSELLFMNRADQLYKSGQLSDGTYLPAYTPYTVGEKLSPKNKGDARISNMTLRDSGDFTNAFKIVFSREGYLFTSTDWKTAMLVSRYGEEIFGLTDENLQKSINTMYKPELIEKFKEKLNHGLSSFR